MLIQNPERTEFFCVNDGLQTVYLPEIKLVKVNGEVVTITLLTDDEVTHRLAYGETCGYRTLEPEPLPSNIL